MTATSIIGELVFAERPTLPATAVAVVKLLDVSLADAPATVVAEHLLRNIAADANAGRPLPFVLSAAAPDPQASYIVSAHVDCANDGRVSPGDYLTMESYPVLTYGHPTRVIITVRRVT